MQFRSIISLFIIVCLIIIAFLGDVAESGTNVDYRKQVNGNTNKKNYLSQRFRRMASNTRRRYKRDSDDGPGDTGTGDNVPDEGGSEDSRNDINAPGAALEMNGNTNGGDDSSLSNNPDNDRK